MSAQYKQQFRVRVPAHTRWNDETRTTDTIKPEYWARVELDINLEQIAIDLGRKAARSKAQRSTAMSKCVKAKVVGVLS